MSNDHDRDLELPRLREQLGDTDAEVAHAARLVASARVRETSDEQADRVWRRLAASGVTTASSRRWRSRSPVFAMRPVFAGFALLGMASLAFAGVTIGRRLVAEWRASRDASSAAAGQGSGQGHAGAVSASDSTAISAAPTALVPPQADPGSAPAAPASPAAPAVEGAVPAAPSSAPLALQHPRTHGSLPDPAVAVNTALDRESESIKDAVRALRRDQDFERARMYLRYYLQQFPDGLFFEEALALSSEAAQKAGDRAEAVNLANRYLGRYPDGRYRAYATQVVRRYGKSGNAGTRVRP